MKLEYMKEYLELVQVMNYSAAAKKLFLSQPALSRHIQAMEKELGFRLVKTSSHGTELTQAGEDAACSFRKIIKEYDAFRSRSAGYANKTAGSLSVGILYYLLDEYFSDFLDFIRKKYPGVRFTFYTDYQPQALYDDLLSGRIQVGSCFCYKERVPEGIRFCGLGITHMVAMMREDHPLAGRQSVTLEELSDSILIQLANDEYSNEMTREMLRECHTSFRKTAETDNIETVPSAIRNTGGVHITGENCRKQNAFSVIYKRIRGRNTTYQFGLAAMEEENFLVSLFMEEAAEYFEKNKGKGKR